MSSLAGSFRQYTETLGPDERTLEAEDHKKLIERAQNTDAPQDRNHARATLCGYYQDLCSEIVGRFSQEFENMDSVDSEDVYQTAQEKFLKAVDCYSTQQNTVAFGDFAAERIADGLRWLIKKQSLYTLSETGGQNNDYTEHEASGTGQQRVLRAMAFMDAEADHDTYSRHMALLLLGKAYLESAENAALEWWWSDAPELDQNTVALMNAVTTDDKTQEDLETRLAEIANSAYKKLEMRIHSFRERDAKCAPS